MVLQFPIGSEEELKIGEILTVGHYQFIVVRRITKDTFVRRLGEPGREYNFFYDVRLHKRLEREGESKIDETL